MFFEDEYEIITSSDWKSLEALSEQDGSVATSEPNSYINVFARAIASVIHSKSYNAENFKRRKIFLSEAYCLLWQQSRVFDRSSIELKTGAYAAILLDLHASKKISITENGTLLQTSKFAKNVSGLVVRIIDPEPTFTFMDRVVFETVRHYHNQCAGKGCSLETLLNHAQKSSCLNACLNNLVSRGILGDFRTHFTTVNVGPILELERELKTVVVKERRPDSYVLGLLTLSLPSENSYSFVDPILEKHLTKREYKVAKENIKMMVDTQGAILKSPRFTRKKFSIEVPPVQTNTKPKHDEKLYSIPASPR